MTSQQKIQRIYATSQLRNESTNLMIFSRIKTFLKVSFLQLTAIDALGLSLTIMLGILSRILFMNVHGFQSDEAIYLYGGYAISKGTIPYREVFLSHAPFMYYIFAFIINLVGPNINYVRLALFCIFLANGILLYILSRIIFAGKKGCHWISLFSTFIFVLYPSLIPFSMSGTAEFILTFFVLVSCIFYALPQKSKISLFLSGIFLGFAFLTKDVVVIPIAAFFFLYHLVNAVRARKLKKGIIDVLILSLGVIIPLAITLVWLTFVIDAAYQAYIQVIGPRLAGTQIANSLMPFSERLNVLFSYTCSFLPLLLMGIFGIASSIIERLRNSFCSPISLIVALYSMNLVAIFLFPEVRYHYLWFLTPFLTLLSAFGIYRLMSTSKRNILQTVLILIVFIAPAVFQSALYISPIFQENPTSRVERYVGEVVADYSNPSDRIWTSEGAIAFFAQRLIVFPNTSHLVRDPFFSIIFNSGVLVPGDFVDAWEANKIKVIVIIRGSGWVPYPDTLLWSGYEGQVGAAEYIIEKYELKSVVQVTNSPYAYEVWVRK